jgi:hypothetical protein
MGAAQAALSLVFGSEAEDKRNKAGVRLSSATAVAVAERVSSIFNLLSKSSPLLWHRQPDSVCFTATDRKEEEAFLWLFLSHQKHKWNKNSQRNSWLIVFVYSY